MNESLDYLIYRYYEEKQNLEEAKKVVDGYNAEIKDIMTDRDFETYKTQDGVFTAKKIVQNRESFNEPKIIEKLKELGITTPVKTVEVIDYDELENVIYNGKLDASALAEFKDVKQVVTLKVTKSKGEK